MKSFICHEAFDVPYPENGFTAPLLFVADEENLETDDGHLYLYLYLYLYDYLETDVSDARKTPEENPGQCLIVSERKIKQNKQVSKSVSW